MTNRKNIAKRTKLALLLVLGPTLLIFGSILVLITSNALGKTTPEALPASCNTTTSESTTLFAPSENCQNELFGEVSPTQTVVNSILFVVCGLSILAWLPCLIIGIILFVRRPRHPVTEEPINN